MAVDITACTADFMGSSQFSFLRCNYGTLWGAAEPWDQVGDFSRFLGGCLELNNSSESVEVLEVLIKTRLFPFLLNSV